MDDPAPKVSEAEWLGLVKGVGRAERAERGWA